jgi:hypothetical protein
MLIRVHLDHITLLDWSVAELEDEIEAALDAIPAARGISADGVPSAGPGLDAAVLPAVDRLAEIPGVSRNLAMAIIAETGLDMTRFPTAAHLASRAGLAPVTRLARPQRRPRPQDPRPPPRPRPRRHHHPRRLNPKPRRPGPLPPAPRALKPCPRSVADSHGQLAEARANNRRTPHLTGGSGSGRLFPTKACLAPYILVHGAQ